MTRTQLSLHRCHGLSLFELLLTVAILGILGSIGIMALGGGLDPYEQVQSRRNAQEIASECFMAAAAGLNFVVPGDVEATARKVMAGGSPDSGIFQGRRFGLSSLDEESMLRALPHLRIQGRELIYQP